MKAFDESAENGSTDWPHPSLCGEVAPKRSEPDEHNQTGILTSASNLTPAFPILRISGIGNL